MRGQRLSAWEIRSAVLASRAQTLRDIANDRDLQLGAGTVHELLRLADDLVQLARVSMPKKRGQ